VRQISTIRFTFSFGTLAFDEVMPIRQMLYVLNIDNFSGGLSALDGMVADFYPGRLPRAVILLPFRQWVCQLRTGGGIHLNPLPQVHANPPGMVPLSHPSDRCA